MSRPPAMPLPSSGAVRRQARVPGPSRVIGPTEAEERRDDRLFTIGASFALACLAFAVGTLVCGGLGWLP